MVWDTIHARDAWRGTTEEWGGIAYALAAAAAAVPSGWQVVPIIKIGRDMSESALRFLRGIPGVECDAGVWTVPHPNNRVDLSYQEQERRCERLTGGVPPWLWTELAPIVRTCDALYVNFISGYELELDAAQALRTGYDGPTYADLHSLFLGLGTQGLRIPRELPSWSAWLRCFDAVQMNEQEFELLGRAWGDPWQLAADVVGAELKLITVTLGARGAAYVAGPSFATSPAEWPALRRRVGISGPSRSARIPVPDGVVQGDPTGCGDVWGATFFARLLAEDSTDEAMTRANLAAARNVEHRGASGLYRHLTGRLGGD